MKHNFNKLIAELSVAVVLASTAANMPSTPVIAQTSDTSATVNSENAAEIGTDGQSGSSGDSVSEGVSESTAAGPAVTESDVHGGSEGSERVNSGAGAGTTEQSMIGSSDSAEQQSDASGAAKPADTNSTDADGQIESSESPESEDSLDSTDTSEGQAETEDQSTDSQEAESGTFETAQDEMTEYPSVDFGAVTFEDGVSVQVSAPEGAFPAGVGLSVNEVDADQILDALRNQPGNEDLTADGVKAFSFSFLVDSVATEPEKEVSIRISGLKLDEDKDIHLYHVGDDGSVEEKDLSADKENGTVEFTAMEFSVYAIAQIGSEETPSNENATSFTAYLKSGDQQTELTEDGSNSELSVGWKSSMTLHIDATFGDGADKTIEISVPEGMTFDNDNDNGGARRYATSNLDGFLKEKIISTDQTDANKKSEIILGQQQYNGTLTLKFFSHGDDNDVSEVHFDVTLSPAFGASWWSGLWESGTAWFYDEVKNPVTVSQSMNGNAVLQISVGQLHISNDDRKAYGTSWTAKYNPDAVPDKQTPGMEKFYVRPDTGHDDTAYQYYSITYFVPEHAKFVELGSNGGKYCGAEATITERTDTVTTTPRGDEIPEGYKAITWEFSDRIASKNDLTVAPVFVFPSEYFGTGDRKASTATIRVGAVHVRYYGRTYAEGQEEPYDPSRYPSLTYNIRDAYEEVFANTYQTTDILPDGSRNTDFKEYDYTHYLGAPGFEHTQERTGGYFLIGNRGTLDSAPKTITFAFDVNNTHAVGVTQTEIPVSQTDRYTISNVQYQTWNEADGQVSDWQTLDHNNGTINLKDIGVKGGSGTYIKAVRFDIDRIPKLAYLKNGLTDGRMNEIAYYFVINVLTDDEIKVKSEDIKNIMTIANRDGDSSDKTDTSGRSVFGYAFEGTTGTKLIYGNSTNYRDPTSLQVGQGSKEVMTYSHHYSQINAQLIDKIYLISPFGEEFNNIRMHYEENWQRASIYRKHYQQSDDSPQPVVTKVENKDIPEELRKKYPKAIYYILDFTGITDPQGKYDSRQIGMSVMSEKSCENTPYSTYSIYGGLVQGVWLTYDFSPNISDPTGTYSDVSWVEFHSGDDLSRVTYSDGGWWSVQGSADIYHLTDQPDQKHLGRMNGFILTPTEGLEVKSAAKQSDETNSFWREYNGKEYDGNNTVMRMYADSDYKLEVRNYSSLSVSGMTAYFPIPKESEDWGDILSPQGPFHYSMSLKGAIKVPSGYKVSYCKAQPSSKYENWGNYSWVDQDSTDSWTQKDWNDVNFVKVEWVGDKDHKTIDNGDDADFIFDLTVDTAHTAAEQMYTVNTWQTYFSRTYTSGTTWVTGESVAAMLVPGYIEGTVWEDTNGDGRRQESEQPISGAHVQLYDITDPDHPVLRVNNQYTDKEGKYRFDGLLDGTAASGWKDNCKVVVTNPKPDTGDSTAADVYVDFSPYIGAEENSMSMQAEKDDTSKASVTVTPDKNSANRNIYDCGLIKASGNLSVSLDVEGKSPLYDELSGNDENYEISLIIDSLDGNFPYSNVEGSGKFAGRLGSLLSRVSALSNGADNSESADFHHGTAILSMKDGDQITVSHLPAGNVFRVDAEKYNRFYTVSYETTDQRETAASGTIARDATQNVRVKLVLQTCDLWIFKIDAADGSTLNGAKFQIFYQPADTEQPKLVTSEEVIGRNDQGTFTVGSNGLKLSNLINGKYTLTEVNAPDGYEISQKTAEFTIKDGKLVEPEQNSLIEYSVDQEYVPVLKVKNVRVKAADNPTNQSSGDVNGHSGDTSNLTGNQAPEGQTPVTQTENVVSTKGGTVSAANPMPDTGDNTQILLYLGIMLASGVLLMGLVLIRMKRK